MFPRRITRTEKPDNHVLINWNHPAARFLTRAFFFNDNKSIDIAKGAVDSEVGVSYERNRANFDGVAGTKVTLDSPLSFPDDEGTIIARLSHDGGNSASGVLSDKNVANWSQTNGMQISYSAGSGRFIYKIGSVESNATGIPFSGFETSNIVARFKQNELMEFYFNEVETGYVSQNNAPAYINASINARIGSSYDESTNRTWNGGMDSLLVFDKRLPISLALSLSRNPYQILQPRTQLLPLTVTAAGGRIMGSLANKGGLAGMGGIAGIGGGLAG